MQTPVRPVWPSREPAHVTITGLQEGLAHVFLEDPENETGTQQQEASVMKWSPAVESPEVLLRGAET